MNYYIKVTSDTGKEIELDGRDNGPMQGEMKGVSINIDTVEENVKAKTSNVLNKVEIELEISENTNNVCKSLMEWALAPSGEDVYRLVHIDVFNESAKIIRSFDLKQMFVEDCIEKYTKEGDKGYFLIKLIQQANKQKDFLHDVNQL